MWFRVEFNRDGSVKKSDRVEGIGRGEGNLVCYVDADSDKNAIAQALAWRTSYLEKQRAAGAKRRGNALARGFCVRCQRQKAANGKRMCADCSRVHSAKQSTPHLVIHKAPITDDFIASVNKKIKDSPGHAGVSPYTIGRLHPGHATQCVYIVKALKALGVDAHTEKQAPEPRAMRETTLETELRILKEVLRKHSTLSNADFCQWIGHEITRRTAADTEAA